MTRLIGRQLDDVLSTCAGDIRAHLITVRETDQSVMGLEITPLHARARHPGLEA